MKDRSDDPSHHERTLLPVSYISLPFWWSAIIWLKQGNIYLEEEEIGNALFNEALKQFYLRLYGVGHIMVKNHSDSERGNPLPPHGLLYMHHPTDRIAHTTSFVTKGPRR